MIIGPEQEPQKVEDLEIALALGLDEIVKRDLPFLKIDLFYVLLESDGLVHIQPEFAERLARTSGGAWSEASTKEEDRLRDRAIRRFLEHQTPINLLAQGNEDQTSPALATPAFDGTGYRFHTEKRESDGSDHERTFQLSISLVADTTSD